MARARQQREFPTSRRLTFVQEANQIGDAYSSLRPHQPTNDSGVTIDHGYDLAARTESEIRADLTKIGMKSEDVELLCQCAGFRGVQATAKLQELKGRGVCLSIQGDVQLFEISCAHYNEKTLLAIVKCGGDPRKISRPVMDLLFDIIYHQGHFGPNIINALQQPEPNEAVLGVFRNTSLWGTTFMTRVRERSAYADHHDEFNAYCDRLVDGSSSP